MKDGEDREPIDLVGRSIDELKLSAEQKEGLRIIKAHVDQRYADRYLEMRDLLVRQQSALERLQRTIEVLIVKLDPELSDDLKRIGLQVLPDGATPDLATTTVVADPVGAGFVHSQADLAEALGLTQSDVSILVRAFINNNAKLAVQVRRGRGAALHNYRRGAVDALREHIRTADLTKLTADQRSAVLRARRSLR